MNFIEATAGFIGMFDDWDASIYPVGVKLVPKNRELPEGAEKSDDFQGMPWCEAVRLAAAEGKIAVIDRDNVGCTAAAIALGLVDGFQTEPLSGKRRYTDLMSEAASPADFTSGYVYACKGSDNMQFALFGDNDSGRYETLGAAYNAVAAMPVIQPAVMDAAIAFPAGKLDVEPDVVIVPVKPKQALLAIQGYSFTTGDRFVMHTIGIRGVCSDLTAMPFVEQQINGSFFCLGARALGGWGGDFLGLGMPFSIFREMVAGMKKSKNGFPYVAYPE